MEGTDTYRNTANFYGSNNLAVIGQNYGTIHAVQGQTILSTLPYIAGAAFNSHNTEDVDSYCQDDIAQCHPGTRVEIQDQIRKWAEDGECESIFWLQGMAGTGKSTLARTIAQAFAKRGELGASFFFKRGEPDRGKPDFLFPTLAVQLASWHPKFRTSLTEVVQQDPQAFDKVLAEQYKKLIIQPLQTLDGGNKQLMVIVLDALDECEGDRNIKIIIQLLSQVKGTQGITLKILITSRPELPIRLGFASIEGAYRNIALHNVPKSIIEHDITIFLQYQLHRIKEDHKLLISENEAFPSNWPGPSAFESLVKMSVPLFIVAATICRFLADPNWPDPCSQLEKVLSFSSMIESDTGQLDATYRPILNQMLLRTTAATQYRLIEEFQCVVGTIVLLAEPLSSQSLARLLNFRQSTIDQRLRTLHSVLDVPTSTDLPIRLLHLSFRDFLVDPKNRESHLFFINEPVQHAKIASFCFELLNKCLKKDICDLRASDILVDDIDLKVLQGAFQSDFRYACLYWTYHQEQSREQLDDSHPVFKFLTVHFLHWLEALSLLERLPESLEMLERLKNFVSTLVRSPMGQGSAAALEFSTTEGYLVSAFRDGHVDIWNTIHGTVRQVLKERNEILAFCLLNDVGHCVVVSRHSVHFWDIGTGLIVKTLIFEAPLSGTVTLSPDCNRLLCSNFPSDEFSLWDISRGLESPRLVIKRVLEWPMIIAFSPDSKIMVFGVLGHLYILDVATGVTTDVRRIASGYIQALSFAPLNDLFGFAVHGNILISNVSRREDEIALAPLANDPYFHSIRFSHDNAKVAAATRYEVMMWDMKTTSLIRIFRVDPCVAIAFSPDWQTFAVASGDGTTVLYDATIHHEGTAEYEMRAQSIGHLVFSPNGKLIVSTPPNGGVQLWCADTGEAGFKLVQGRDEVDQIADIAFSPDSKTLASCKSGREICIWDLVTGTILNVISIARLVYRVAFCADGTHIAYDCGSAVQIVGVMGVSKAHNTELSKNESPYHQIDKPTISSDGKLLLTHSSYKVHLWRLAAEIDTQSSPTDIDCSLDWHCCAISNEIRGQCEPYRKLAIATSRAILLFKLYKYFGIDERELGILIDGNIRAMSFTSNGKYLVTNRGVLQLPEITGRREWNLSELERGVALRKEWITFNGKKLVWIPPQYRTDVVAVHGNTVALGQHNGKVMFIKIDEERLRASGSSV